MNKVTRNILCYFICLFSFSGVSFAFDSSTVMTPEIRKKMQQQAIDALSSMKGGDFQSLSGSKGGQKSAFSRAELNKNHPSVPPTTRNAFKHMSGDDLVKSASSHSYERHMIKGLWISPSGRVCMIELEDNARRSCLVTFSRKMDAKTLMVSNGPSILMTFMKASEFTVGDESNDFIPYRDNQLSRLWFQTANIDKNILQE